MRLHLTRPLILAILALSLPLTALAQDSPRAGVSEADVQAALSRVPKPGFTGSILFRLPRPDRPSLVYAEVVHPSAWLSGARVEQAKYGRDLLDTLRASFPDLGDRATVEFWIYDERSRQRSHFSAFTRPAFETYCDERNVGTRLSYWSCTWPDVTVRAKSEGAGYEYQLSWATGWTDRWDDVP